MVDYTSRGPVTGSVKFGAGAGIQAAGGSPISQGPNTGSAQLATLTQSLSTGGGGSISPVTVLIGLVIVIVSLRLIGDSPKTSIEGAHIHIGGYNVITMLLVVWFGTVFAKTLLNRWQVPGLTDVINAV